MKGEKSPTSTFGKLKSDSSGITDIRIYYDLFKNDANSIADAQYNDLNIKDLFDYSNRCVTPVGEMLLYCRLRHISKCNRVGSEEIIAQIEDADDFRKKIEDALSGLVDRGDNSVLNALNVSINLSKWHRYFKFLPIIYIVILTLLFLFGTTLFLLLSCLIIFAFNTFIHYWNKSYVEVYVRPLVQLNKIRGTAIKLSKIDKYNSLVKINDSIREMSDLSSKVGVFSLNRFLESELMVVCFTIIETIKTLFLVEPIVTNTILTKISDVNLHSKRLVDYIGEWDVLYSISSLREWMRQNNYNWSIPTFTKKNGCLYANQMYHPLILDCVPNSIKIDKSVIITGSNMSGKSSFIKTIGVNIIASYAINTCFAEQIVLPECNLYSVLSVSDDINNAKSYYFSEAQRIKSIIDKCRNAPLDRTNVVLIDEIFKGTNTVERISIANAVIKYFAKLNNTIVIVSTHDIELARSFREVLHTCHFSEEMVEDELRFNYKLISGIEYTRNAISILKSCDYPQEIIDSAELNTQTICKNMDSISL